MQIMELILHRLDKTESEPELELALGRTGEFIREYCGLSEIPEALYPLWADMTADCYAIRQGESAELAGRTVTAVAMGDVSYSFADGAGAPEAAATLLADYKQRLNKARRGLFR